MALFEYKLGLRWYKLMLKYSWISNNKDFELIAFEGIANWYYYLERLKKSSFYHKRAICGNNEPDDSNVKSYLVKRYTVFEVV